MGSAYVNDFDFNNRSYRVYVQADKQFRARAQRHQAVLRPLRQRCHDSPREPRDHRLRPPLPRSSATTICSARPKSTARPPPATAPARPSRHGRAQRQGLAAGLHLRMDGPLARRTAIRQHYPDSVRTGNAGRLPDALRAIRKLRASLHRPARGADGIVRSPRRAMAARTSKTTSTARSVWSCWSVSPARTPS